MAKTAFGLGQRLEPVIVAADRFGRAEQQHTALVQCKVEQRDGLGLRLKIEIDQQIAARHQIDARKWRIGQHILHGKHDLAAQRRGHAITGIFAYEEPRQPVGRHNA